MKASRTLGQVALAALSMSSVTAAWPTWSNLLPDIDALIVRDTSSTTSASAAEKTADTTTARATTTATAKTTADSTDKTTTETTGKTTGKTTATTTGTGKKTTSDTKTTGTGTANDATTYNLNTGAVATGANSTNATHTAYSADDPAGGIVMTSPASTAASQFYKIGDYVTWGWNYTDLLGTPTALDILVSCSSATRTYTLTQNMTFETKGVYTWDTKAYQEANSDSPLLTQLYTLIIYDAESSISATAEPGYLGVFDSFVFGLYTPQPYTPLADGWKCASCSAGVSENDRRAIGFAITMSVITVLSFTWFVQGLHLA